MIYIYILYLPNSLLVIVQNHAGYINFYYFLILNLCFKYYNYIHYCVLHCFGKIGIVILLRRIEMIIIIIVNYDVYFNKKNLMSNPFVS